MTGLYGRQYGWERATLNPYAHRRGRWGGTPYYAGWQGQPPTAEVVVEDVYDDDGDDGDGSDIGCDPSDPGAGNPGLPSRESLRHSLPLSLDTRADEPSLGGETVFGLGVIIPSTYNKPPGPPAPTVPDPAAAAVGYERGYTRNRRHIPAFPVASTTSASIGHEARVSFGQDWSKHRHHHHRPGGMSNYGDGGSAMNTPAPPFVRPAPPQMPYVAPPMPQPAPPNFGWDYDIHNRRQYYEHTNLGQYTGDHGRGYTPEVPPMNYSPAPPFVGPGWHTRGFIPQIPEGPRRMDYPFVPPPVPPPPPQSPFGAEGDASMGWMMPTLPGAISESPLRGVFSPDTGLSGSMGLGGLG